MVDLLDPMVIIPLILIVFALIIIVSGIRVIKEWERAPVLGLG